MSTDLPTPAPSPRPAVPPDGEPELPTRDVDELGDDEDLPIIPGERDDEPPDDQEEAPWPSSAPTGSEPMTFRDEDGRVHLKTDMRPADLRRAADTPAAPIVTTPGLLRS